MPCVRRGRAVVCRGTIPRGVGPPFFVQKPACTRFGLSTCMYGLACTGARLGCARGASLREAGSPPGVGKAPRHTDRTCQPAGDRCQHNEVGNLLPNTHVSNAPTQCSLHRAPEPATHHHSERGNCIAATPLLVCALVCGVVGPSFVALWGKALRGGRGSGTWKTVSSGPLCGIDPLRSWSPAVGQYIYHQRWI